MKRYTRYKESITNANELASELQEAILKIFPKSGVVVEFSDRLYPSITIWFMLAKNKSECPNGIVQNDIAYQTLSIHGKGKEIDKDGGYLNY
jgi:hypothetical protein